MATSGPLYPGTAATEVGPSGDNNWLTEANVGADDGSEAQITAATYDSGDHSYRLKATNFGFAIPAGSTIDGITVEIDRRCFAGTARDQEVRLYDSAGTLVGTDKATATAWPATTAVATYGGSTDTWAAGLTVADINSTAFGVALIVAATSANVDIGVDFIRVTITYTPPASEDHSGTLVATGGGVVTQIRRKGGLRAISNTGGGTTPTAIRKGGRSASALAGGGTVVWVLTTNRPTTVQETGGGIVTLANTGGHTGTHVETGGGTVVLAYDVASGATGVLILTGGGTVVTATQKGGLGTNVLTASGILTSVQRKGGLTAQLLTGGGVVTTAAEKTAEASVSLSGSGSVLTAAQKAALAAQILTGGGAVLTAAQKAALQAMVLTGGGTVVLAYVVGSDTARNGVLLLTGGGVVLVEASGQRTSVLDITGGGQILTSADGQRLATLGLTGGGSVVITDLAYMGELPLFEELVAQWFSPFETSPTREQLEAALVGRFINEIYSRPLAKPRHYISVTTWGHEEPVLKIVRKRRFPE